MRLTYILLCCFFAHVLHGQDQTSTFDIHPEITVDEIQTAFKSGQLNAEELTQFYLDRIEDYSFNGPKLNAVITVNPDALEIAKALDVEMQEGKSRGMLHGIPILLKDNIDTGDKMPCTAGAIPMAKSYPLQDSPLAAQLREAGAVILGKANLSEWANFHSELSSSGWSALGGQVKNPYELSRNPCGSSSGSGVAVSANLCVIAIGTETNGSIVCPSNNNGIVGIKPTVGLVSRTGIIPISHTQDTGGPMARTVKDAALCLSALTDKDPKDGRTNSSDRITHEDYTKFLDKDGIKGKRIGVWRSNSASYMRISQVFDEAIKTMEEQGAILVPIEEITSHKIRGKSYQVLLYEFKHGLNEYFKSLGNDAQVSSLEDLIEKTFADETEMQYHDHSLFHQAQEKGDLTEDEYTDALAYMLKHSRMEGIDKVMDEHSLDAIMAPTGSPAWKTDWINGDNYGVFSSSPAAMSGYPNITVPMGNIDGLPLGVSIFGRAWSEDVLISIAYGYEQATKHRLTPKFRD